MRKGNGCWSIYTASCSVVLRLLLLFVALSELLPCIAEELSIAKTGPPRLKPIGVDATHQLFLDNALIALSRNVSVSLHRPVSGCHFLIRTASQEVTGSHRCQLPLPSLPLPSCHCHCRCHYHCHCRWSSGAATAAFCGGGCGCLSQPPLPLPLSCQISTVPLCHRTSALHCHCRAPLSLQPPFFMRGLVLLLHI